ncbi:reverse transcriptase [Elysia marginata]|uniref:Reverse transcriptase n=1 Tax=Elysia marginata TaxID=1093978 RepID=A0AAV4F598_9GAST|nr:reverse transcriptase [Elysia marginata]
MPPLKAFMDDNTIICSKEEETRRMLARFDTLMAWCRMKFKPKKSRSLSIRKGRIEEALVTMLEESDDPVGNTVQPSIKTGRKWKVAEAIDEAKECLRLKEVIGQTQTDRKGLWSSSVKWWSKTEGKEKKRHGHR